MGKKLDGKKHQIRWKKKPHVFLFMYALGGGLLLDLI
jgi:hypothetical protein